MDKVMGWQPIETAPKDGTPILLFGPHGKWGLGALVPQVFDQMKFWSGTAAWIGSDRWNEGRTSVSIGGYDTEEATHWMPLPSPPESA